ncbi:MAG: S8 family serine peptidase [Pseudomonadota bacterium]
MNASHRSTQVFRTVQGRGDYALPQMTAIALLIATVATMLSTLAHAAPARMPPSMQPGEAFAQGRLLIEPRPGLSASDLAKLLSVHGGRVRKLGQSNLHLVTLFHRGSERSIVEKLKHDPRVKYAELDARVKSNFVPNDPYYGSQYHHTITGTNTAWDTTQGAGVTIAILDSGIDRNHPDLSPNLVPGYNTYDNNTDTSDVCGHGTAVAGTAAATSNNGVGVAGIAGGAKIMPIRIAYFDTSYNSCYAYYSTVAAGLTYAADHGARIANISYGGVTASSAIQSAAQYMKNKGGLVFVSAGNNGVNENLPATTLMIPVSATDSNDTLAPWSSFGTFVAISAPGVNIWTTSQGGGYQPWNGTSFASPLTAGIGALMMAANPSLDAAKIESLLYSTTSDLGTPGRDQYFGYGRVNAAAAVRAALAATPAADSQPPTTSITTPSANVTVSGIVPVNLTATDNVGVVSVELRVNGATVAIDNTSPFGFSWDSTSLSNGTADLTTVAYDAAGMQGTSPPVTVNVANNVQFNAADTVAPVVTIANPVSGKVAGVVTVNVQATDNSSLSGIVQTLYIDGALKAKAAGGALSYNWNTRKVSAGVHIIKAVAKDAAGNIATTSVQVTR